MPRTYFELNDYLESVDAELIALSRRVEKETSPKELVILSTRLNLLRVIEDTLVWAMGASSAAPDIKDP